MSIKGIKALGRVLSEKRIGAAVFISTEHCRDPSIEYLCGFTCGFCILVVRKNSSARLIVPRLELERARKNSRVPVTALAASTNDAIRHELRGLRRIGINRRAISAYLAGRISRISKTGKTGKTGRIRKGYVRLCDVGSEVRRIRQIKNKNEVEKIAAACRISDMIFQRLVKRFKTFRSEADAKGFVLSEICRHGLMPAFEPIVASGKNASMPHYVSRKNKSGNKLERGFLIVDLGVRHRGYCSDCTRTFFVGRAGKKEKELYRTVLDAQELGISICRAGATCSSIDKAVRKRLGPLAGQFIHGLGHGVGAEVHEEPNINDRSKEILEKGMVVTVEPGIYRAGKYGIRIEDTVAVQGKKSRILTGFPKRLIEL